MKIIKVGILQGFLSNPNMGSNALCYSAMRLLKKAGEEIDIKINYNFFSNVSQDDLSFYPALNGLSIKSALPFMSNRQIFSDLIRRKGADRKNMNSLYDECDIFFEIAGGDSFSDIYGMERLYYAQQVHNKIKKSGKPLVFLPQTIGPFECREAQSIAKNSLEQAEFIFVRDPVSYEEAIRFASACKVFQSTDMACFMDYLPRSKGANVKKRIGINPSALLWHGGYLKDNQFGLVDEYQKTIKEMIKSIDLKKFEIILVPHVLNGPEYHIEDDYRICRILRSEFPFCQISPYFYTPNEAKSFISGLDLLVGSRMHACIASYTSGVPVYPLAYSRKFKGLFADSFKWPHVADLRFEGSSAVLASLSFIMDNITVLKDSMSIRLDEVKKMEDPLVLKLKDLLLATIN